MKGKKHSPDQIIRRLAGRDQMLNEGRTIEEVTRQFLVTNTTWYRWKNQYWSMKANDAKQLKELYIENRKVKTIVADLTLDNAMLREISSGKF